MTSELPIDKRSPRHFWDDQHKKIASKPLTWVLTADELLRAFELLATHVVEDSTKRQEASDKYIPSISSSAMMLGGFAIENMLKAIYVSRYSAFDSSGNLTIVKHDLLTLADALEISLTKDERMLLERLTQFITWAGRYPVPLYIDDMRPRTLSSDGLAPRTCVWIDCDFEQVRTLVAKLRTQLPTISDGSNAI